MLVRKVIVLRARTMLLCTADYGMVYSTLWNGSGVAWRGSKGDATRSRAMETRDANAGQRRGLVLQHDRMGIAVDSKPRHDTRRETTQFN